MSRENHEEKKKRSSNHFLPVDLGRSDSAKLIPRTFGYATPAPNLSKVEWKCNLQTASDCSATN